MGLDFLSSFQSTSLIVKVVEQTLDKSPVSSRVRVREKRFILSSGFSVCGTEPDQIKSKIEPENFKSYGKCAWSGSFDLNPVAGGGVCAISRPTPSNCKQWRAISQRTGLLLSRPFVSRNKMSKKRINTRAGKGYDVSEISFCRSRSAPPRRTLEQPCPPRPAVPEWRRTDTP